MDLETVIPSWWSDPQKLFDIFKNASAEFVISLAFGLLGYALVRWLGMIPVFQDMERGPSCPTKKRSWIVPFCVMPLVASLSLWRYRASTALADVPQVHINPQEYINMMSIVVAITPGFIIMPIILKRMKKSGTTGSGNTEIIER